MARSVGISPAQLARLESNQRGLYLEDFVSIAETLGEKAGNLLPNDLGDIGHLKPVIDRLVTVRPEFLARVAHIVGKIVLLTEDVTMVPQPTAKKNNRRVKPRSMPALKRKERRDSRS